MSQLKQGCWENSPTPGLGLSLQIPTPETGTKGWTPKCYKQCYGE